MPSYVERNHPGFRGLNLRDGVDNLEAGQAVSSLDVVTSERGVVRSRPGSVWERNVSGSEGSTFLQIFRLPGGRFSLAVSPLRLQVHNWETAGASGHSAPLGTRYDEVSISRVSSPGASDIFVARYPMTLGRVQGSDGSFWDGTLVSWDATTNVLAGKPRLVVTEPATQRLLLLGFVGTADGPNGTATDYSMVIASDPANPAQYRTDNYFRLGAGDGEKFTAVATWRELTFIFKRNRFWVVTGAYADAAGQPVFQRRVVDVSGIGCVGVQAVAAGRDGVYFMGERGVYLTNGGEPQLVSDLISPLWGSQPLPFLEPDVRLDRVRLSKASLRMHGDLLICGVPTSAGTGTVRQYVLDTRTGDWHLWALPMRAHCTFEGEYYFVDGESSLVGTLLGVYRLDASAAGDRVGAYVSPFTAHWRSGWTDFGDPSVKTIAAHKLWIEGVPALSLTRDFGLGYEHAQRLVPLAGGELGAVKPAMVNHVVRATQLGVRLSGMVGAVVDGQTRGPWAVHRVTHHLREVREPTATVLD